MYLLSWIFGFIYSFITTELLMLERLTHGPLTVGVDATSWQNYQGGIIQYHCDSNLNHAVQVVGYDLSGNKFSGCTSRNHV